MGNNEFVIIMEPGCGVQLALKLVADYMGKSFFVVGKDPTHTIRTVVPFLPTEHPSIAADDPAAFASNLQPDKTEVASAIRSEASASGRQLPSRRVVCFADEKTTDRYINSFIKANVLCICYNTSGRVRFVKAVGLHKYAASASIAYPEDLKSKIEKAKQGGSSVGSFIEVLTPCPKDWGFDPSNTVVVARSAVESGVWPLFEVENKRISFTYKPAKLESLDIFLNLQRKLRVEQGLINKNWKAVVEDRYWEIE